MADGFRNLSYHDARGQSVQNGSDRRGRDGWKLSKLLCFAPGQIISLSKKVLLKVVFSFLLTEHKPFPNVV